LGEKHSVASELKFSVTLPKRTFGDAALIEEPKEKAKMRNLCNHDSSSIVDSRFYGHLFSTPTSKRIFL
jgi:hypothetical protein